VAAQRKKLHLALKMEEQHWIPVLLDNGSHSLDLSNQNSVNITLLAMKTRIILLIGAAALVTLSFTFAGGNKSASKSESPTAVTSNAQPVGGLYADIVE
jgi:hypothetical protein